MTGTGVIDDPFLVSSYDEIKQALNDGQYVKLTCDIDCNDYGPSFKWNTINMITEAKYLDLDGHTIKNIVIPQNNKMFYFGTPNTAGFEVYNGKLLNIFCENASGVFDTKSLSTWHDLSVSVNSSSATAILFSNINFERCAIDLETAKMTSNLMSGSATDCDLCFNVADMNGATLTNNATATNCRIAGTIGGETLIVSNGHYLWSFSSSLSNCVVDFDTSNLTCDVNIVANSVTNCVINLGDKYVGTNGYKATTEQIRDPEYNNSVGFTVVEVTD